MTDTDAAYPAILLYLSCIFPLPSPLNVAPFLYLTVTTTIISHPTTTTMPSLIQHQKSTKHCPCLCCDPSNSYKALLEACLSSIDKYFCPECRQRFVQEPSLEAYQHKSLHVYCYNCDILSSTRQLHTLHMQSHTSVPAMTPSSVTQFWCCDCECDFKNEETLTDHLRCSKVHRLGKGGNKKKKKKQKQQEEGNQQTKYKKCERTFKNQGVLGQHLTSV
jgi:hypothetical protein